MKLDDFIEYEQPQNYIVESDQYDDNGKTPVLTAGQSFILGYTNEENGIFNKLPVVIFDDFTTSVQYVDFPFKVKSSAMKILRNRANADIKYCYYLLNYIQEMPPNHKRQWISSVSQKKFNLPSIGEQKSIVEKLDKVAEIISNRRKELEFLDELIKARFVEIFGDKSKYKIEPLSDNVEEMFIGPFGSALKNEYFVDKNDSFCMVYEQKHAIQKTMDLPTRYVDEKKYNELKRFTVLGGDIIVSCRGTIGEIYSIPEDAPMGIMHPSIMKIRLKKEKYCNLFFVLMLEQYMQDSISKAKGSGVKMAVTATELGKELFVVPDIEEQIAFERFVKQLDKSKVAVQAALDEAQLLFDSLMQKYFG